MSETPTVKPLFTFKEVIYIVTLVSGFLYNNYSLKMEIHEAVLSQAYQKEIVMQQLAQNNKRFDGIESRLLIYEASPANKPKETKIETE